MLSTFFAKDQYLQDGTDILQIISPGGAIYFGMNEKGGIQVKPTLIAVDGAIAPRVPGFFIITKGSAAALTLAAPTAGVDDGLEIEISSRTAFAHVITATGLLETGTASVNSVTYPTLGAGGTAWFTADNGKWIVAVGGTVGANQFVFA